MNIEDKYLTFEKEDIGKHFSLRHPFWFQRLWWWFLALFGKDTETDRYVVVSVWPPGSIQVERLFVCPKCCTLKPYSEGCADESPELCDDCWEAKCV